MSAFRVLIHYLSTEAEAIEHHGDGAERHRGSGNHRANKEGGVKQAGSYWHRQHVVEEGPEEVLVDDPTAPLGESDRLFKSKG